MLGRLLGVRKEDQRDTVVAFTTLVAMMAAHAMLETARDALFLAKLPPEQLPVAYLAIAVLALGVTRLNVSATARFSRRRLLSMSLLAGGFITALFWQLLSSPGPVALMALYVWTGLLATVVVVQFWLQLGDVLDVTQAKRVFSLIAAGGLVGATLGSLLSSALLELLDARALLTVSGALFGLAALGPFGFRRAAEVAAPRRRAPKAIAARGSTISLVTRDGYLLRLFAMVLVGAVMVTGIDFVFKAKVVAEAERYGWELGSFFARYYAAVNGIALLVQLFVAPRLMRAVGVNRALLLMPALLLLGSVGFVMSIGLLPAMLLKGTDGTLRHSVHRTASEILYLPLARPVREQFKGFAEAVGQRGGQALASLLILGVTALDPDPRVIGVVLVGLGIAWTLTLIGLQPLYLDLFRRQLRDGMLDTEVDVPDLDLASFETLVSALSAEDDAEVIAALEMLDSYGKTDLVPALILYHPSRAVVLRAFELFARSKRNDVRRLTERLLRHEDDGIRAAALRTLALGGADEELLRKHLDDASPEVRSTATVALIAAGYADASEAEQKLRGMVRGDCDHTRLALAGLLPHLPPEQFGWVTEELGRFRSPELTAALARSIAIDPDERFVPLLIDMLATREARADARSALLAIGAPALEALADKLDDASLTDAVRTHLPRTISRFPMQRAADVLVNALTHEHDERVEFKILRGLGRLRVQQPTLTVPRDTLLDVTQRTLERAVTTLSWRLGVGRVVALRQRALTPAAELLIALLDERDRGAIQRVFRLLHILEPRQEFRIIYDGLRSQDAKAKASSRELLSHVVPAPLRDGILAMVDDVAPRQRLRSALTFYDPPGRATLERALGRLRENESDPDALRSLERAYARVLRAMLDDPSEALRSLVSYHVAELGLDELHHEVRSAAAASTSDTMRDVARGALELLGSIKRPPPTPELSGAS